jgi:hypothetical protein
MKLAIAIAALGLAAAPAAAQTVQVGSANWSHLTRLSARTDSVDYEKAVSSVEAMVKNGTCRIGESTRTFDIAVPYAVLVEPNGTVSRILVSDTKCVPLQQLVGIAALTRVHHGDFELPAGPKARWYRSEMNFTLQ